jgi:hypothetical protein
MSTTYYFKVNVISPIVDDESNSLEEMEPRVKVIAQRASNLTAQILSINETGYMVIEYSKNIGSMRPLVKINSMAFKLKLTTY